MFMGRFAAGSALENDVAESNLAAILEQHGVAHVRSL